MNRLLVLLFCFPLFLLSQNTQILFSENSTLKETDINGSYVNTIHTGSGTIYSVEIDNVNNEIYWSEANSIYKSSLNSFSPQFVTNSAGVAVYDLYFSNQTNTLYWQAHNVV